MKTIRNIFFLLTILSIIPFVSKGQSNFGLKISTLSGRFTESKNSALYTRTLDSTGNFSFEPGMLMSYENFFGNQTISIKFMQGFYNDCTGSFAMLSHVGIRFRLLQKFKHSLNVGIGPTLFIRQDWSTLEGYVEEDDYEMRGDWQYKMSWFTGEIEYTFYLTQYFDLATSINFIHPQALNFAVGMKYWISKKPKRKPCDCPSFR